MIEMVGTAEKGSFESCLSCFQIFKEKLQHDGMRKERCIKRHDFQIQYLKFNTHWIEINLANQVLEKSDLKDTAIDTLQNKL